MNTTYEYFINYLTSIGIFKSGNRTQYSLKMISTRPSIIEKLVQITSFLPTDSTLKYRLAVVLGNYTQPPKCQNSNCQNFVSLRKDGNNSYLFNKYCCLGCFNTTNKVSRSKDEQLEKFLKKSKETHGNKYDYSCVSLQKMSDTVTIICPVHGKFDQCASEHMRLYGCKLCGLKRKGSLLYSKDDFIKMSSEVHNNFYNYDLVEFKQATQEVSIICPIHGIFIQARHNHVKGVGCKKCAGFGQTTEDIIKRFRNVHGDLYDYSEVKYTKIHDKVKIRCLNHGIFYQKVLLHIHGQGCRRCSKLGKSKQEKEWLDVLNVTERQYVIFNGNKWCTVDGYDRNTNTIFEFLGDYWHGNPKVYDSQSVNKTTGKRFVDLYEDTFKRFDLLRKLNYNIVYIWENDWKSIKKWYLHE